MKNHHTRTYLGILTLALSGLFFALAGIFILLDTSSAYAQTAPEADYIGSKRCASCHRSTATAYKDSPHSVTLSNAKNAVLADFTQGDDIRMVTFPGESEARSFSADDIAFAIGSGRNVQRYLYKVAKDQYAVFPAEWNTVEKVWEPYTLAASWPDPAYDWNQNCAGCHTTGLDPVKGRWDDPGVQCEACHGPGSVHAKLAGDAGRSPSDEELTNIRANIVISPDPQICGQCHSQGTESSEGRPYPIAYRPGNDLGTMFNLVAPDDKAHWRMSGQASSPNMQFNEWMTSGHSRALKTMEGSTYAEVSCLQCHSADYSFTEAQIAATSAGDRPGTAPEAVNLTTAEYGVTCTSCHSLHGEGGYDYLLKNEPYALCASCHEDANRIPQVHHPVKELYESLPIVDEVKPSPSSHFTQGAICTTCHMPLTVEDGQTWRNPSHTMLPALPGKVSEGQPDSCTGCHTDLSKTYMQQFIDDTQTKVLDRLTRLEVAIGSTPDAAQWIQKAVAFVSGDGSLGIHNYAYVSSLLSTSEQTLHITEDVAAVSTRTRPVEDPTTCAKCHQEEYNHWQASTHANATQSQSFLSQYAERGRPDYCMSCHASGYDPRTGNYALDGVTCSSCHYVTGDAPHPPGPVEVATDSAVCGQCHTGEHAPAYDEWLLSNHSTAGIDCADCHSAHDTGLILDNVNATCNSCHAEAMMDPIHMGDNMTCVDCHMTDRIAENGILTTKVVHTMGIDPGVCAECHGNTHLLSVKDITSSQEEQSQVDTLKEQLTTSQNTAAQNLNSGIVGGAIGALALVIILYVVMRLGRGR